MKVTSLKVVDLPAIKRWPAEPRRVELLTVTELKELPHPEWLIKGIFRAESQVLLYGPSGHGKSYVALDMALSIATGTPWHGRPVKKGPVVYVVSEGGRGIVKRVIAWMEEHDVADLGPAFFLLNAVQFMNEDDVNAFLRELRTMEKEHGKPVLIVLDTFARSFVGGEENSAKDTGVWIDASNRVQAATGATVIAVHHSGKLKENGTISERGSSAIRAAVETAIKGTRSADGIVTVNNDKQKDDEEFDDLRFAPKQVIVGTDEDGEPSTSLVLTLEVGSSISAGLTAHPSVAAKRALEALCRFPLGEAQFSEWRDAMKTTDGRAVSDSSFNRWKKELERLKLVEAVPGKRGRYRVDPTAMAVSSKCLGGDPTDAPTTPPRL